MSNKCKVLILGEKKAYADNEEKRNQQIQQIKDCRKQKFETFKQKFNKGLKDVKGIVTGDKKIGVLDNKKK
tara:strand:+ start:24238 stop:24450 length:213 start_codon:yes stop_codon:yes gene_type:complete